MEPVQEYDSVDEAVETWIKERKEVHKIDDVYSTEPMFKEIDLLNTIGSIVLMWLGFDEWSDQQRMRTFLTKYNCPFHAINPNLPNKIIILNSKTLKLATRQELSEYFSKDEMRIIEKYSDYLKFETKESGI